RRPGGPLRSLAGAELHRPLALPALARVAHRPDWPLFFCAHPYLTASVSLTAPVAKPSRALAARAGIRPDRRGRLPPAPEHVAGRSEAAEAPEEPEHDHVQAHQHDQGRHRDLLCPYTVLRARRP